ncbi:secondary thiamine-phosphate synthase enzyme YjbQ [Bittarella massiliensis (ex Durand et al. 2017)]|nr:secondary thiamine-phosphate synthase enzyme YjbQ [Bittarella massiliensis (ex Durand et al. 2017)]
MHFYETKIECPKDGVVQLTEWLRRCVRESGVQSGIAVLSAPHTTSGISFNPYMLKPEDHQDIQQALDRLIPMRIDYAHQFDNPADAAGHNKSALMGTNTTFIVEGGELVLGSSQGVFFFEFDGPRTQRCQLAVYSDSSFCKEE